jgi:hypothetical protein
VRPYRLKKIFAYKRTKANLDQFHMCFTISLQNFTSLFSLLFAYFRFKFFASLHFSHFCFEVKQSEAQFALFAFFHFFFALFRFFSLFFVSLRFFTYFSLILPLFSLQIFGVSHESESCYFFAFFAYFRFFSLFIFRFASI